jgi:type II secretory pathway component PulM
VPFSSIVDWLGEMQTSAQLIVTDASITARNGVDQVDASFSLHQLRP